MREDVSSPAADDPRRHLAPHQQAAFAPLVGDSRLMGDLVERLARIASRDATLLLEGDSGTGKELAARAVHAASAHHAGPFLVVDCRANLRGLGKTDLLGAADGGTLFFDEIGELDPAAQPRLARLLEHRELGGHGPGGHRRTRARLIAASTRDLCLEAAKGRFRAELYYRLAVNCVRLPSLVERLEDIPRLWRHFAAELPDAHQAAAALDDETLRQLARRPWPGNIRELRNLVEQVATFGRAALTAPPRFPGTTPTPARRSRGFHDLKAGVVAAFERDYLTELLAQHGGNITASATAAGVHRVHFLRLLDRHGLRKARD
jgi:DNA-binding NtrC family response regulator